MSDLAAVLTSIAIGVAVLVGLFFFVRWEDRRHNEREAAFKAAVEAAKHRPADDVDDAYRSHRTLGSHPAGRDLQLPRTHDSWRVDMEVTIMLSPLEMALGLFAIFCIAYTVLSLAQAIVIGAKSAAELDELEAPVDLPRRELAPAWTGPTDYHQIPEPLAPAISLDFAGFGLGWQGESTGAYRTLDAEPPPVLVGEVQAARPRFERKPAEPLVEHVLTIHLDERYDDIRVPLAVTR